MIKGILVVNEFLQNSKFSELTSLFLQAAQKEQVELAVYTNAELYSMLPPLGGVPFPERDKIRQALPVDFVIFWDKDIFLAKILEELHIPVYNGSECIAVCDDKRKTHEALWRAGLPMPQTIFAPMTYDSIGFTNVRFVESIEEKLGYPMVVKEAFGSFGEQVFLARNREDLEHILETQISSYQLLFQEYVETSRGRDVRIQVVGKEVVAAMYRYSERDFRANITAGGKMKAYNPSEEERALAVAAAEAVEADFAGVDLLFGRDDVPLVCEVNSNAHFKNLLTCTGINTAEKMISYIKKKHRWNAWLVYDEKGAQRNRDYIAMHMEMASRFQIGLELVMVSELQERIRGEKPDFVIFRSICPAWTKKLEEEGIQCFNNSAVSEICNDKEKTIAYVKKHTNGSVFTLDTERYRAEELNEELLAKHRQCVIKAVAGHGGTQVFSTEENIEKIRAGIGTQDFIIQPMCRNDGDIRVYVIGKEIIASVKRTPREGFKSNFSLGGHVERYHLNEQQREKVNRLLELFDFGLAGIDFFDSDGEFVFNEIEDVVGARMLYQCCPEIDLLERYFSFIVDKMLH